MKYKITLLCFFFVYYPFINCHIPAWWECPTYEESYQRMPKRDEIEKYLDYKKLSVKNGNFDYDNFETFREKLKSTPQKLSTIEMKEHEKEDSNNAINSFTSETHLFDKFNNFLSKYKYHLLIACTICSIHQIYLIKLKDARKLINSFNTWSTWKNELTLENFYKLPQEELLNELIEKIYEYYGKEDNESIEQLYLFIFDTKKEIKQLQEFITIYKAINFPILSWFFPNLDEEFILAEEKIEKLSYMQDIINEKFSF